VRRARARAHEVAVKAAPNMRRVRRMKHLRRQAEDDAIILPLKRQSNNCKTKKLMAGGGERNEARTYAGTEPPLTPSRRRASTGLPSESFPGRSGRGLVGRAAAPAQSTGRPEWTGAVCGET
jgi:hypothetical protein